MKTILLILILNSLAFAQENKRPSPPLGVGLGIGFSESSQLYKYESSDTLTIPTILWNAEHFHIRGLNFSYYLHKGFPSFNITLQPIMLEVSNDVGSYNENLSKRYRTVNLGFEIIFPLPWFATSIHLQHDTLNKYGSFIGSLEIKRRFPVTEHLNIGSSVSFNYLTDNYVNYYFGVNQHEVNPQRNFYRGQSGYSISPSLSFMYSIDKSYQFSLINRYTQFSSEISRSPLVQRDDQWSFFLGVSKFLN